MILQICDPKTNDFTTWITVSGLIRFRVVRSAGSRPSTLVAYVAANKEESEISNTRFWPFQGIRVVETDGTYHADKNVPVSEDPMYFAGRIDNVYLKEDIEKGRVWEIHARCWLGVLADNNVTDGRWASCIGSTRKPSGQGFGIDKPWEPKYVDKLRPTTLTPWGEFRSYIIWDLCMNAVPTYDAKGGDNLLGIAGFAAYGNISGRSDADYPLIELRRPNSLPVSVSFTNPDQSILSAIQSIANSDPWCDGLYGEALLFDIDSTYLATDATVNVGLNYAKIIKQKLPPGTRRGIGGDLQMQIRKAGDGAGRTAEYLPKGWQFTGVYAYYGKKPPTRENTAAQAIAEIDFGRDGLDTYTSAVLNSGGQATTDILDSNTSSSGEVTATQSAMSTWDPAKGKFRAKKTKRVELPGLKEDLSKLKSGEEKGSLARASVDAAAASIFNTLASSNGGIYRGNITIAGRPKSLKTKLPIRPGELMKLHIPHLGIKWADYEEPNYLPNNNSDFVIEQWSYEWPDERTVFELTKQQPGSIMKSMFEVFPTVADSLATNEVASPWVPIYKVRNDPTAPSTANKTIYLYDLVWNDLTSTNKPPNDNWEMFATCQRDGSSQIDNTSVEIQWRPKVGTLDKNSIVVQFGIWDGMTTAGTFRLTNGSTLAKDYHPIQETVRDIEFNNDYWRTDGYVKLMDNKEIVVHLPYQLDGSGNVIDMDAWEALNTQWLTSSVYGEFIPTALNYPSDPAHPSWITRNTPNLLIRIRVKKKV